MQRSPESFNSRNAATGSVAQLKSMAVALLPAFQDAPNVPAETALVLLSLSSAPAR
jgi:hypothetical protein